MYKGKKDTTDLENIDFEELCSIAGDLFRECVNITGEGEISDVIGYGGKKYAEEVTFRYKGKDYLYDHYNQVSIGDNDPLTDKTKLINLIVDVRERLARFKNLTRNIKKKNFDVCFNDSECKLTIGVQ